MITLVIALVLVTLILQDPDGELGDSLDAAGWRSVIEDARDIDLILGKHWTIDGNTLIGDSGNEQGGLATFGRQDWRDYELDFYVTMITGANASCFIRQTADGKKFYACNTLAARKVFRVILLDNTQQNPFHDLSVVKFDFEEGPEYHMRIVAHGNSISTYVDGEVVNNVSDDTLLAGHAAFALWNNRVRIREPRYRLL